MNGPTEGRPPARTRVRKDARASARRDGEKLKCTIILSREASRRLTVHAAYQDLDRSGLVEALIGEHCRRFVVQDRDKGAAADRAGGAVDAA